MENGMENEFLMSSIWKKKIWLKFFEVTENMSDDPLIDFHKLQKLELDLFFCQLLLLLLLLLFQIKKNFSY